mgnify:FL=1
MGKLQTQLSISRFSKDRQYSSLTLKYLLLVAIIIKANCNLIKKMRRTSFLLLVLLGLTLCVAYAQEGGKGRGGRGNRPFGPGGDGMRPFDDSEFDGKGRGGRGRRPFGPRGGDDMMPFAPEGKGMRPFDGKGRGGRGRRPFGPGGHGHDDFGPNSSYRDGKSRRGRGKKPFGPGGKGKDDKGAGRRGFFNLNNYY